MKSTRTNKLFFCLLFFLTFVLAVLVIVAQKGLTPAQREFILNEPAPRTVFSPIHLTFLDGEETGRLQKEKQSQVLPVYTVDPKVKRSVSSRAEELLKERTQAHAKEKKSQQTTEEVSKALALLFERFLNGGILEDATKKELKDSGTLRIRKLGPEKRSDTEVEWRDLASLSEAKDQAGREIHNALALEIFKETLQPNLFFDEAQTRERLKQAADLVAPIMEELKRGEMIIQKGLLVTAKEQKRLIQIQKKMAARQAQSRFLTVGLLVFLGLGLSFLYLKQFEPKQLRSPRFLVLILTTFLLTLVVERITLLIPGASLYLLPGALGSVLLTILWSPSAGILGAFSISILSIPLAEFRLEIILMLLLGSLVGSFAARRIRKRIHFLKVGLAVGTVNAAVLVALFPSQDWQISEALALAPLGFANSFLVTALSFFLVPLLEPLFNLTTDVTLLELSDLNHPLLKRMVVEAPGTYHHSLTVSTLAEAACEAIDANALLARVGCYFHDIGKIARSEYFTENQTLQTGDRHNKLTPTMSCLVIMNHVKDGIELAKKYKLKDTIVRFIPEHQGTGIIYYFYKKALDQAAPGETVNADDFRYAGPKPQSRETAVALLADSVEATSRSLKEITPAAIQTLVRKIINEKFIDGQLDECDLTLKDLHKIQESFVHNLMAIFHTRVSYPVTPSNPRRPDLFEEDQFIKFREN